jgi:hypothetical protein
MSRPCLVCTSEHVVEINSMLAVGHGPHFIAKQHPEWASAYAIKRHMDAQHHHKVLGEEQADSREQLNEWIRRADTMWKLADEKHDLVRMDKAATLAAKFMELRMRRDGELVTDSARREREVQKGLEKLENSDGQVPLETLDKIMRTVDIRHLTVIPKDEEN